MLRCVRKTEKIFSICVFRARGCTFREDALSAFIIRALFVSPTQQNRCAPPREPPHKFTKTIARFMRRAHDAVLWTLSAPAAVWCERLTWKWLGLMSSRLHTHSPATLLSAKRVRGVRQVHVVFVLACVCFSRKLLRKVSSSSSGASSLSPSTRVAPHHCYECDNRKRSHCM